MSSKRPATDPSKKSEAPSKKSSAEIGEGSVPDDLCNLTVDVDLEGVRADALRGLAKGSKLRVRLDRAGSLRSAVCVREDGLVVGSLSSFRNVTQLLNCLERGVEYAVTISRVSTGSCHVQGGRVGS
jgi:hypothetical protein